MYEINWYIQIAVVLALFVETLKRSGGHYFRDTYGKVKKFYPLAVKGIAFAAALILCFGAEADVLLTLEIEEFAPEIGYVVGAILIVGGDTLIDAAWDKRKPLAEFVELFAKGKINAPPV